MEITTERKLVEREFVQIGEYEFEKQWLLRQLNHINCHEYFEPIYGLRFSFEEFLVDNDLAEYHVDGIHRTDEFSEFYEKVNQLFE